MTIAVSIAGTITVAVTVRMMYLIFLSGKTIRSATLTGRFVDRFRAAVVRFAGGWTGQGWRYRLIAFPCMLLTMAGVSAFMYWLMPVMHNSPDAWDVFKYCILIFLVGVSACITIAFLMIFGVYLVMEITGGWWENRKTPGEEDARG